MENRMMSGSAVESYAYDPANHQVEKKIGTTQDYVYFWGLDGRLLATYSVTGSGSSWQTTIVRYRIYLGKMLAGQTSPGYGNAMPMEDRLGTVTAGYPYGTGIQAGTGVESDVDFATYSKDSMTGFEYANQRYYSGGWGRFLSADRASESAYVYEPLTMNRYTYVRANPANITDSQGLDDDQENGDKPSAKPEVTSIPGKSTTVKREPCVIVLPSDPNALTAFEVLLGEATPYYRKGQLGYLPGDKQGSPSGSVPISQSDLMVRG